MSLKHLENIPLANLSVQNIVYNTKISSVICKRRDNFTIIFNVHFVEFYLLMLLRLLSK
jgi:hypothetical protein